MEDLFTILFFLFLLLVFLTLVVVGFVAMIKWIIGLFTSATKSEPSALNLSQQTQTTRACCNCGYSLIVQLKFCGICGAQRLTLKQEEELRELEITLRQLERLHESG